MAHQTAVEWLESTFYTYAESFGINNDKWGINELKLEDILAIAKQMGKEQAFQLFKAGQDSMEEGGKNFEQYYKETFGNK